MWRYVIKRILLLIPIVLCVTTIVFTIMYITPGDAVDIIAGSTATEEERAAVAHSLGLDQPYIVQLGRYMYNAFIKFDLGQSYILKTNIATDLAGRLKYTVILSIISIVAAVFIGIPAGIFAALHQNKAGDRIAVVLSMLFVSIPHFWLGLMLVLIFAVKLGWLPPYGIGGLKYWILPLITSGLGGIASMCRQTRSSMLDVLTSDYIVTAKSKGLSERKIIYRHALPNALLPIITIAGTTFGGSLGGGLILEQIFSIPGVSYYLTSAINNRDTQATLGGVVVLSILFCVVMLITDLVQAFVDPRVKAQYAGGVKKRRKK
ncbi:MAG: ABC transporter permease [Oscillospiraceae bacterium]